LSSRSVEYSSWVAGPVPTIITTLGDVAGGMEFDAPTVAVIGEVVALRERLGRERKTERTSAVRSGRS
jgi:hypothetical protein